MKKLLVLTISSAILIFAIAEVGIIAVMLFILKVTILIVLSLIIILYLLYLLAKMMGEFFEERDNRTYDEDGNLIITDKMQ